MADTPAYEWPWPLNDVDGMQSPPTEIDLSDVFVPIFAQCESLVLAYARMALVHGDYEGETCASYAGSARVLRDYLRLARQIFLAYHERDGGTSARAEATLASLVVMMKRHRRVGGPDA